jgi:hypothetical protein
MRAFLVLRNREMNCEGAFAIMALILIVWHGRPPRTNETVVYMVVGNLIEDISQNDQVQVGLAPSDSSP